MARVFPRTAEIVDGRLIAIGGVPTSALAAEHASPLYVLDAAELTARMRAYRDAFGPQVDVVYAAKALCVVGVLQLAAAEGLFVDVASAGELATAERAGFPPERIVFHGNNKSPGELAAAARLGVGRTVADSFAELDRLDALGARSGRPLDVLLRVTPGIEASTHAFIATGHDGVKFGFSLAAGSAAEAVARALSLRGLRLRGLHCHIGSQVTASGGFARAAAAMCGLLAQVRDRHGVTLTELNLGGGLGIAYRAGDEILEVADYAADLLAVTRAELAARGLAPPRLAIEPGRSITGPAGVTLYTVGTVKETPGGVTWAAVDGGMSDNLRPALYGASYTVVAAGDPRPVTGTRRYAVAGKHCETG
ncbi:MAG: diaminopimelate decarboxylase, partial [Euzebyales bacterium]|nr:diaminopimelate decarboxylase [Euzebyales bacterium]